MRPLVRVVRVIHIRLMAGSSCLLVVLEKRSLKKEKELSD
jgi:hypothetical protein